MSSLAAGKRNAFIRRFFLLKSSRFLTGFHKSIASPFVIPFVALRETEKEK